MPNVPLVRVDWCPFVVQVHRSILGNLAELGISAPMSLMGKAAMVAWHNLAPGSEADHDDWHSHEHMFERVAIPGFRRGRRCRAVSGSAEQYFLMYEVDDLSVLTAPAYQARLNDPSEWSQRIIPTIREMTRTLCNVLVSVGGGLGASLVTFRFSPVPDRDEELIIWLRDRLPELCAKQGVTGIHLLAGDPTASGIKTDEARLRGGHDQAADLVLLLEGYDSDELNALADDVFSADQFADHGGLAGSKRGEYRVVSVVSEGDLPAG
ncbi:MAG: hypothetical protein ACJASX_000871 [Limisphaerales bacterium]|jgi:hypothetical protein